MVSDEKEVFKFECELFETETQFPMNVLTTLMQSLGRFKARSKYNDKILFLFIMRSKQNKPNKKSHNCKT